MTNAGEDDGAPSSRTVKSEAAFRTISEVSEELDVPQHVLRFWESKFAQIKPLKRGGGRRYYRPEDIAVLMRIRDLLYRDGYTIRGAQKYLRESGRGGAGQKVAGAAADGAVAEAVASADETAECHGEREGASSGPSCDYRAELEAVLAELEDLKALLADADPEE